MIVIVEFLLACGILAVVGSLIYVGYNLGKAKKKDETLP